jgi:hypothetical protein
VIYSKKMILSSPEGLEGQKIREAQHEFSTPAHANASRALLLFYRDGQSWPVVTDGLIRCHFFAAPTAESFTRKRSHDIK